MEKKISINQKYKILALENRKEFFIGKNGNELQKLREKKAFKITRSLDNYYSALHNRVWYPNGVYQIKRRYKECEIGFEHFYEKNNVEQLNEIPQKNIKKTNDDYIKPYKEYEKIKKGKFIITIEYCSQCHLHSEITQHDEETFKKIALNYQKIIQERFPFIQVLLKPIDVDILKNTKFKLPKLKKNGERYENFPTVNSQFKECRIGAFEIQMCTIDDNNEKIEKIIHSKLKSKCFPKVKKVLEKILFYMPKFELKVVLFDKEDYIDIKKMNNIEVNIYLFKSDIVKDISDDVNFEILKMTNPKIRLETMKNQRYSEKLFYFNNYNLTQSSTFSNWGNSTQRINNFRSLSLSKKKKNKDKNENENKDINDKRGKLIDFKISQVNIEENKE